MCPSFFINLPSPYDNYCPPSMKFDSIAAWKIKWLKLYTNKKVLLREHKRHTVHRVASACYPAPSLSGPGMGYPPSRPGMGYPPDLWWGIPPPDLGWGTPPTQTWDGVPPTRPGTGYCLTQTWDGVPPRPVMGYPPTRPGMGYSPHPDMGWGSPPSPKLNRHTPVKT